MARLTTKIRQTITRFTRSHEGVAVVEFALIMPLLLLLYLGTVEASRAISYDRRLTTIVASMGDLVARSDAEITAAQLADYFQAAEAIISPFAAGGLKQVVTSIYIDNNGIATVAWSEPYNGGVAHNVGDLYPTVPTKLASLALDDYIIVSEAEMPYNPLTTYAFPGSLRLYKEYFHLPRFGERIEIIP